MALPNNKWDCPTCTYSNWSSSLKCSLCGCPRSFEITPKATVAKIKSHTQNSLCHTKSTPSSAVLPSSVSPSETSLGDKWMCSVCTYKNTLKASTCTTCRSIRPKLHVHVDRSPSIFDYATSTTNTNTGGAVGGVSSIDPLDQNVKKYHKQRHSNENSRLKRWKCLNCTYENYPRSSHCTMCGVGRGMTTGGTCGVTSPMRDDLIIIGSQKRRTVSSTIDENVRQLRNRLSPADWLFLQACEGVTRGDIRSVKDFLKNGGDKQRQLTRNEILVLGGNRSLSYSTGVSLIDLALRFNNSDILTCLLTPAPTEAHKRLPSQSNLDLAATIRSEVSCSLRQREGEFPCYYFSNITTFSLPKEVNSFSETTRKKIMEEVVDLDVLRVLQEENPVINWNNELVNDLHSKLYPLWNRTAGDCLLDSTLQATWGVSDRDYALRKALADSLTDCSSQFFTCWHSAEVFTADSQGFSLDDNQLKADWLSIVSLADLKGSSLDQTHVFVLAHILRRPIIVYSVKIIENFRGEQLGPVNYEGVYLPLLWDSSFCSTTPIALGYTRGHFSALVSISSSNKESDYNSISCDDHVTYLPLVDNEGVKLPIHFISEQQLGCEDRLLKEYCDCYVTRKGLQTVKQCFQSDHTPHHVTELIENWLDRFYQFNKQSQSCSDD